MICIVAVRYFSSACPERPIISQTCSFLQLPLSSLSYSLIFPKWTWRDKRTAAAFFFPASLLFLSLYHETLKRLSRGHYVLRREGIHGWPVGFTMRERDHSTVISELFILVGFLLLVKWISGLRRILADKSVVPSTQPK